MPIQNENKNKSSAQNNGGLTPDLPPVETKPGQQRVFPQDRTMVHDLYKLEVSSMLKNISWNSDIENVSIEHCHFFHSVDSDGKVQTTSNSVGGHFHVMEVIQNASGAPTVKCSGPKTYGKSKYQGKYRKAIVPYYPGNADEGVAGDNHTHEVTYIRSCEIHPRVNNTEALKVISADAAKTAAIPGVR